MSKVSKSFQVKAPKAGALIPRREQLLALAESSDPDIRQPAVQDLWLEFGIDLSGSQPAANQKTN